MNKFKDFLYDKSDILIALGILLIAALIIAWRLAAIVEYPKEIIDENNNATVYEEPADTPSDEPSGESEGEGNDEPSSEGNDEPSGESEGSDGSAAVWGSNGLLTNDVTVTFEGNSATAIVDCAVNAGLFEDYYDYANVCLNNGISDPEQIPIGGTITFEAGMSQLEVAMRIKGL
ncbi:MAG: hypothetical protein IKT62_06800 [Firmicutes bacterium]|nr:hypothetical protein [Bacillota bacterium]